VQGDRLVFLRHIEVRPGTVLLVSSLLAILAIFSGVVSLAAGSVPVKLITTLQILFKSVGIPVSSEASASEGVIILQLRLPRVLLAASVGAGLSIAGVVFQAMFRNPLAEPYILGISSGGTFGALVALGAIPLATLKLVRALSVPIASLSGALIVMTLVYVLGQKRGRIEPNRLLLTGVMVGAFFNALILVLIVLMEKQYRNAFLWLMGNLSEATYPSVWIVMSVLLIVSGLIFLQAHRYNLIAMGEETARHLGVETEQLKHISYFLASVLTGVVVSASGVIGFVGLVVPHICRRLFGPDHRMLIPAAFFGGATFLILADLVARLILSPMELPVGVMTAFIGAPVFVTLLRKSSGESE